MLWGATKLCQPHVSSKKAKRSPFLGCVLLRELPFHPLSTQSCYCFCSHWSYPWRIWKGFQKGRVLIVTLFSCFSSVARAICFYWLGIRMAPVLHLDPNRRAPGQNEASETLPWLRKGTRISPCSFGCTFQVEGFIHNSPSAFSMSQDRFLSTLYHRIFLLDVDFPSFQVLSIVICCSFMSFPFCPDPCLPRGRRSARHPRANTTAAAKEARHESGRRCSSALSHLCGLC